MAVSELDPWLREKALGALPLENGGFDQPVIYAGQRTDVRHIVEALEAEVRDHRATMRELAEARNLIAAMERGAA